MNKGRVNLDDLNYEIQDDGSLLIIKYPYTRMTYSLELAEREAHQLYLLLSIKYKDKHEQS